MKILVTGGAGFIGSALIREIIDNTNYSVMNIDKLTYAGNLESLSSINNNNRYRFEQIDICDYEAIGSILKSYQPDAIMHLAAESHVDRSITGPKDFIETNILGTFFLLQEAKSYWESLKGAKKNNFRFHHVSTDEVFGDLGETNDFFTEDSCYAPSSPYSASKAASDHLVRVWYRTYGLPIVITNCSNNYGPYQYPEKLIPTAILNAINGKKIPVYGSGNQVRDWLYVEDHARALVKVVTSAEIGKTYNVGGHHQCTNFEIVQSICNILDGIVSNYPLGIKKFDELITFVEDRPGHDVRYAIDASKIYNELAWKPRETFETGLFKTVQWYLNNKAWSEQLIK